MGSVLKPPKNKTINKLNQIPIKKTGLKLYLNTRPAKQGRIFPKNDFVCLPDNLAEGLMILDHDFSITKINQYLNSLFQFEQEKIIGKKCYDLFFNKNKPCTRCPLTRSHKGNKRLDYAFDWRPSNISKKNIVQYKATCTVLQGREDFLTILITLNDATSLARLNQYFETLSSIASLLLRGDKIRNKIIEILKMTCQSIGTPSAYWFENAKDPGGDIQVALKAHWRYAENFNSLQSVAAKPVFFKSIFPAFYRNLSLGEPLIGTSGDFPLLAQFMTHAHASVLIEPLMVNRSFHGFLVFESPGSKSIWHDTTIHFIRSVAHFLTKAIEHEASVKELKESEDRYHDIFENIDDAWYLHDMNGRFLEVNPAFEKATGYSKDELLLKTIPELIPERYRHQFYFHFDQLKNNNKSEGLMRIITKDGEEKIGNFRNWIVTLPNGQVVSRGLIRDVTDRIKLQAQLRHAQRMESMGVLVSGISHNFRNILSGTMSYSQLIQMKYKQIPELQKYTDEILKLSKMGSDLIADLLKFSRKTPSDQKAVVNLSEILNETHHIIAQSFNKHITLRTKWPDVIPVYADRSALSQVFMNLCTNARDAMPEGGLLDIRTKEIKNKIVISITDSGVGMDDKIIPKIFDPFFTTKEPGKGTGLGLSTAYGIVKDIGGEIRVTSHLGKGSTFEVLLPRLETSNYNYKNPMPKIINGSGEKILIVDDDSLLLEPIAELFTSLGYQTTAVGNGETAIEQYKKQRPDLVLLDRNMPGLDGLTTAQMILSFDANAKIIIVSGYENEGPDGLDDRIRKMLKGYLTKPLDIEETSQLVAKVLKNE